MEVRITTEMLRRDHWFIARCPELDFVSQGASVEEAKRNLLEVIEIQFEEMAARGTLEVSALCTGLLTGTPQRPKVSRTWRRTTPELGRPAVGPGARWPRGHPRPAPSRATLEPAFSPE